MSQGKTEKAGRERKTAWTWVSNTGKGEMAKGHLQDFVGRDGADRDYRLTSAGQSTDTFSFSLPPPASRKIIAHGRKSCLFSQEIVPVSFINAYLNLAKYRVVRVSDQTRFAISFP